MEERGANKPWPKLSQQKFHCFNLETVICVKVAIFSSISSSAFKLQLLEVLLQVRMYF